jgi:hypothetical protein
MCAAQSPVFCGQPVETFCSVKIHHSDCGVFLSWVSHSGGNRALLVSGGRPLDGVESWGI